MSAINHVRGRLLEKPHLGVITDESGEALALPPGAVMLEIIDAKRPDRINRLVLKEVKHGKWTFKCGCNNPRCTRVITFRATETGAH